jgi:hypothetical protein
MVSTDSLKGVAILGSVENRLYPKFGTGLGTVMNVTPSLLLFREDGVILPEIGESNRTRENENF